MQERTLKPYLDNRSTLTPQEAAQALNTAGMSITAKTLRDGIEQGAFPFGIFVAGESRIFYISRKKLAEFIEDFCGTTMEVNNND